jgi:hypothetical protein
LLGICVLVVLLLAVMPALLYLMGWGVTRYTRQAPGRTGFPVPREKLSGKPDLEPPPRVQS